MDAFPDPRVVVSTLMDSLVSLTCNIIHNQLFFPLELKVTALGICYKFIYLPYVLTLP